MKRKQISVRQIRTALSTVAILIFLAISLLTESSGVGKTPATSHTASPLATAISVTRSHVSRVIDGDTIELSSGEKVRYIGLDAPELKAKDRKISCYGNEAFEANKKLVEGQDVTLEKDKSDKDQYGRLLRYVYINGMPVGAKLISDGYARAKDYPPDSRYKIILKNAETQAISNQKGLWSQCT